MKQKPDAIIIFKDKNEKKIKTFITTEGHGLEMEIPEFLALVADYYGHGFTLTKAALIRKLRVAAERAVFEMKSQTRDVAAINPDSLANK